MKACARIIKGITALRYARRRRLSEDACLQVLRIHCIPHPLLNRFAHLAQSSFEKMIGARNQHQLFSGRESNQPALSIAQVFRTGRDRR